MNFDLPSVLEALAPIIGSAVTTAAIVRRLMGGPLGKRLAELVSAAMREEIRAVVREETEAFRERVARLEGVLEGAGLMASTRTEEARPGAVEGSRHG
jgi:predicted ArsR family transcriptional regulator